MGTLVAQLQGELPSASGPAFTKPPALWSWPRKYCSSSSLTMEFWKIIIT